VLRIFLKFFYHAFSADFLGHLPNASVSATFPADAKYHAEAANNKWQHEPNAVETDDVEPINNKQNNQSVVPLPHLRTRHSADLEFLRRNSHRGSDS
jgi:hypothetical protein